MHLVRKIILVAIMVGLAVAGPILFARTHVGGAIRAFFVNVRASNVYLDTELDSKGRLVSVVSYYRGAGGEKILHGDSVKIDWDANMKMTEHYRYGEMETYAYRAIMPDGRELTPNSTTGF